MIVGRAARRNYFLRCFRIIAGDAAKRHVLSDELNKADLAADERLIDPVSFGSAVAALGEEDVVFAFDVLPRFEKDRLPAILEALAASGCTIFFVVPLTYSNRLHADGSNLNKTVETREWWGELLGRWFGTVEAVKTHSEYDAAFVTRPPAPASTRSIDGLSPGILLANERDRLACRAVILARTLTRSIDGQAGLLAQIDGRSVSVVGNARSLGGRRLGEGIDANDVVVRFNRAPIISRAANGYRTDWLATSVPLEPESIAALAPRRLLWMSRRRSKMNKSIATAPRLYLHPKEDALRLAARAGVERPSTGLMMIDLLARSRCRSVELYGFDFYKSQSLSGHQSMEAAPHAYDREEAYVIDLIASDSRFKICR